MSAKQAIARNLAAAFLGGAWSKAAILRRATLACGHKEPWLRPLIRRACSAFDNEPLHRKEETLARFILQDKGFALAWIALCQEQRLLLGRLFFVRPGMSPVAGAPASWALPQLVTPTALADWLGLKLPQLHWFADCHGHETEAAPGRLRHYTYRLLPKAAGKWRLLEMPKPRLKAIQRRLLYDLLNRIPPHDAAHGYRRQRSIITFASPHCGQRMVLRFDLRNFFPSVRSSRIHSLFAAAGYPLDVARLLTGLCTNVVPGDVWRELPSGLAGPVLWQEQQLYKSPHLPQGAPTSPAMANLCAYRLDCRLHGLAQSLGAVYTRYADDLAFSGDKRLERSARRFQVQVCRTALEEGFEVNTRKSRFMRQGVRQQLVGVVVNVHPNIRRADYDCLKAILHNCVHQGPASQNLGGHSDFRGHLLGRIDHVTRLNAARGQRLHALFDQICWEPDTHPGT